MLWNMVDVRDVAKAHRIAISKNANNGSDISFLQLIDLATFYRITKKTRELFPDIKDIGGERMENNKPIKDTYDSPRSYCKKAIQELGLSTFYRKT